jgi:hypothetical protein
LNTTRSKSSYAASTARNSRMSPNPTPSPSPRKKRSPPLIARRPNPQRRPTIPRKSPSPTTRRNKRVTGGGLLFCVFYVYELRSFSFLEIPPPFLLATDGALQMAFLPIPSYPTLPSPLPTTSLSPVGFPARLTYIQNSLSPPTTTTASIGVSHRCR